MGKDYLKPKAIQFHLKDVERQMTAQYYVTEFNKSLYDKEVMAQIFFIPSEALLVRPKHKEEMNIYCKKNILPHLGKLKKTNYFLHKYHFIRTPYIYTYLQRQQSAG